MGGSRVTDRPVFTSGESLETQLPASGVEGGSAAHDAFGGGVGRSIDEARRTEDVRPATCGTWVLLLMAGRKLAHPGVSDAALKSQKRSGGNPPVAAR